MLVAPSLSRRDAFSTLGVIKSFLLLPQTHYPIVAPGWSLVFEMFFYVVIGMLLVADRRWFTQALAIWAAITVASYSMSITT